MFLYWKKRGAYELEALPASLTQVGMERYSWSSSLDVIHDLCGKLGSRGVTWLRAGSVEAGQRVCFCLFWVFLVAKITHKLFNFSPLRPLFNCALITCSFAFRTNHYTVEPTPHSYQLQLYFMFSTEKQMLQCRHDGTQNFEDFLDSDLETVTF